MAKQQTIIRTPKGDHPYFPLSRALAQDRRLSYEARGVLVELLSRPPNWEVQPSQLMRKGCGRDKIYRILAELHQFGYLTREKHQDATGRWEWQPYRIYEKPLPEKPYTDLPYTENTDTDGVGGLALQEASKQQLPPYTDLPYTENTEILQIRESTDKRRKERAQLDPDQQLLFAAAAAACGWGNILTERQRGQLLEHLPVLIGAGATADELASFAGYWFSPANELFKTKGDAIGNPYPSNLANKWGQFKAWQAAQARRQQRTQAPARTDEPAPSPADVAARFRELPEPDFVRARGARG